jgi:hypothetical protein
MKLPLCSNYIPLSKTRWEGNEQQSKPEYLPVTSLPLSEERLKWLDFISSLINH